jgi:hypothetical protein
MYAHAALTWPSSTNTLYTQHEDIHTASVHGPLEVGVRVSAEPVASLDVPHARIAGTPTAGLFAAVAMAPVE